MEVLFTCFVPDRIEKLVDIKVPYQNFNSRGQPTSFGMDLGFKQLGLTKTLKSTDLSILRAKAEDTLRTWDEKYQRHLEKQHLESRASSVESLNEGAIALFSALAGILAHTLAINDAIDWARLKKAETFRLSPEKLFPEAPDRARFKFRSDGFPTEYKQHSIPTQPDPDAVRSGLGLLTRLFSKEKVQQAIHAAAEEWKRQCAGVKARNEALESQLRTAQESYLAKKAEYDSDVDKKSQSVDDLKERYEQRDPKAIEDYCDMVLEASNYPEMFPKDWTLEYRPENQLIAVDYHLPAPDSMPPTESYRYVKSRDEIVPKQLSASARKALFDSVIYQTCLRTVHELFEADTIKAIEAVAFNGIVTHVNPANGQMESAVIASMLASRESFEGLDLSRVDPKAAFRLLKGVSAASLIDLTPIPPVIRLDRADPRIVEGRQVAYRLDQSVNLAAMDWADFEHLIREIFEKEFMASGGEVKVTQASADHGVDAIAFDPDPIRGGKIVIQAKRYTNTVGVAAVRDLFGTVMNEGATKGILVTTSDYGRDSYEFAQGKPLTLLNGSNLLALLEKHGHRARINIGEARKILGL